MPEPEKVRSMFARIAGRYDLLNRVLSMGIDQRWRKRAVRQAEGVLGPLAGRTVIDVCCGTGDSTQVAERAGARVIGIDFTYEMLAAGHGKFSGGEGRGQAMLCHGDGMRLPLPTGRADLATVSFGIRNVADRMDGLREMARVVRPGGLVQVLEFSNPKGRLMGGLYRTYFTRVLPRIGGWVSGDREAYRYLPDTVLAWPSPEAFLAEFEGIGLEDCGFEPLTGGIASLHWGRVPASSPGSRSASDSGPTLGNESGVAPSAEQ